MTRRDYPPDTRIYRVLLFDDEELEEHDKLAPLRADPHIHLVATGSLEEARAAVVEEFFHLALVDLQLDANDDRNIDGKKFLRELFDGRPACRRILLTRTAADHRREIFELANPDRALIHGAVDKNYMGADWVRWVQRRAQDWVLRTPQVDGIDVLAESVGADLLGRPAFGEAAAKVCEAELEFVVSSLFAPDRRMLDDPSFERDDEQLLRVERVSLDPLAGGDSGASVFVARLASAGQDGNVTCIVKVAPRAEALQEEARYRHFARFRVSADHRAEQLGAWHGDTVGAAAYAFAGTGDLDGFFEQRDDAAIATLRTLFERDSGDLWRPVPDSERANRPADVGGFFFDTYEFDADKVGEDLVGFAHNNADELGVTVDDCKLQPADGDGPTLELPSPSFYGRIRPGYRPSLVHGDLNPRNVLVADDGRVRLIDFRFACVGPVAVDFAALEANVRLSGDLVAELENGIVSLYGDERRAIGRGWHPRGEDHPQAVASRPYWAKISIELTDTAKKFDASEREYLACCLFYALRLFQINDLGHLEHVRLIPWIAALRAALAPKTGV